MIQFKLNFSNSQYPKHIQSQQNIIRHQLIHLSINNILFFIQILTYLLASLSNSIFTFILIYDILIIILSLPLQQNKRRRDEKIKQFNEFFKGRIIIFEAKWIVILFKCQIDKVILINQKERFSYIKDQALFNKSGISLNLLLCISCGKSDHQLYQCPYLTLNLSYKPSNNQNERNKEFWRKRDRMNSILKQMSNLQEKAMAALANNDESAIIDALTVCRNTTYPIDIAHEINHEDDDDNSFTSSTSMAMLHSNRYLNQENRTQDDLGTHQIPYVGTTENVYFKKSNFKNIVTHTIESDEKKQNKSRSSIGEEGLTEQNYFRVNQNTALFDQDKDQVTDNQQRTKELSKTYITEESLGNKNSMRSIKLTEEFAQLNLNDKYNNEKPTAFTNLQTHSEKISSQKSSNYHIYRINTQVNMEPSRKHFDQPEIFVLKQTFEKRKQKAVNDYKYLQRSISDRLYIKQKASIPTVQQDCLSIQEILLQAQRQANSITNISPKNQDSEQKKNYLKIIELLLSISKMNTLKFKEQDQLKKILLKPPEEKKEEQVQCVKILDPISHNTHNIHNQSHTQSTPLTKLMLDQNRNSTEYQIRCQQNLQNLDMLVIRKQFQLMQQQNQIQNFIEVPDNEVDIDVQKDFRFYDSRQNLKFVLYRIKKLQYNQIKDSRKRLLSPKKIKKQSKQKLQQSPILLPKNAL